MIAIFAHVTPTELPTGLLLFLTGFTAGLLAMWAMRQFQAR